MANNKANLEEDLKILSREIQRIGGTVVQTHSTPTAVAATKHAGQMLTRLTFINVMLSWSGLAQITELPEAQAVFATCHPLYMMKTFDKSDLKTLFFSGSAPGPAGRVLTTQEAELDEIEETEAFSSFPPEATRPAPADSPPASPSTNPNELPLDEHRARPGTAAHQHSGEGSTRQAPSQPSSSSLSLFPSPVVAPQVDVAAASSRLLSHILVLIGKHFPSTGGMRPIAAVFEYQGFNPLVIAARLMKDESEDGLRTKEILIMICIVVLRGTALKKIKDEFNERLGVEGQDEEETKVMKDALAIFEKYKLEARITRRQSGLSLARISSAFPALTRAVRKHLQAPANPPAVAGHPLPDEFAFPGAAGFIEITVSPDLREAMLKAHWLWSLEFTKMINPGRTFGAEEQARQKNFWELSRRNINATMTATTMVLEGDLGLVFDYRPTTAE